MSRQEILERERRWRVPAAIAAALSLILLIVPAFIQGSALEGDTGAEQLASLDSKSGAFLLGAIARGLGFVVMLVPLLYVFTAARARSEAVRGAMVGFVVVGPLLFGAQTIMQAAAYKDVSAEFVAARDAGGGPGSLVEVELEQSRKALEREGDEVEEVTFYPDADAYEVETGEGQFQTVDFPAEQEDAIRDDLEKGEFDFTEEEEGDPGDALITSLLEDSSLASVSSQLLFPALLALIVGLFYTSLQAMRTGLFTRFFGTLGMALAVSVLLLGPTGLIVYVAGLGLVIVGRTPSGRPPAWDAGEALPWPKPGEDQAAERTDARDLIEGDATDLDEGESPHAARRQRAKRKKRKRR